MWTNQRTHQGDTLASLSRAYGVPVEKILAANSIRTQSDHTDSYLSRRAQECMIPSNLPRKTLSKLVLEHDVQRWVHSVGGDCIPLRAGSKAEITRLLACAPGEFCHFSSESSINLPHRKRREGLAGLGAPPSMLDLLNQLNSLKTEARRVADKVVSEASMFADDDEVQGWKTGFLSNVDKFVNDASKTDASGTPLFIRKPDVLKAISSYVASAPEQASGFVSVGFFNNSLSTLRSTLSNLLAAAASFVSETPSTPAPSPAKTPSKKDTSALAPVRAGATTLKRGAKGDAVRELQGLLAKTGLTVQIDGAFGPQTEGAIKDFQKFRNLPVNGVLDANTLRDLDAVVAAGGKVTTGRKASTPRAKAATPAPVTPAEVAPPPPPPVITTTRSSNTMLYAAVGLGVLLVAGAAIARR